MNISGILENYELPGEHYKIQAFGSGNIHDTFKIEFSDSNQYILQRLNTHVFRNPSQLMGNYQRIFKHLENKRAKGLFTWQIPNLLETYDGKPFYTDHDGFTWRLFFFIPHTTIPKSSESIIKEAGRAYGRFIFLLADLPQPPLNCTIPNFHDLAFRIKEYENALAEAIPGRLSETRAEQKWLEHCMEKALGISTMHKKKLFPLRHVHHDAKTDNILFSEGGEIQAIVDLDTVMPGCIHSDFGDAVRSFANTVAENDKRSENVNFRFDVFSAYAGGFIPEIKDMLADAEKDSLWQAPFHFAYMQGLRFLNDFLSGDIYYKTDYNSENLIRARNQFALAESIKNSEDRIKQKIDSLLGY